MKPMIRQVCFSLVLLFSRRRSGNNHSAVAFVIPLLSPEPCPGLAPPRFQQLSTQRFANTKESAADTRTNYAIENTAADAIFATLLSDARTRLQAGDELSPHEWYNILAACSSSPQLDSVLQVIQEQNHYESILKSCLTWCEEAVNADFATAIVRAIEEPDASDISLVVRTLCGASKTQPGLWKATTSYIEQHDNLCLSAYEAYLGCLSQDGLWQDSVQVLRRLQDDSVTKPCLSTYCIVIECCLNCKQVEKASQLLLAAARHNQKEPLGPRLCERVVTGLARKLQWRRAMQIVNLMDEQKLPKSLAMYNSLLTAFQKSGEAIQARNLLQRMKRDGIQPNTLSYNSVISVCANPQHWKDALQVFDQCLREPGVAPDIYSYTNAIRACAKGGKADRALSLLQVAQDMHLPVDAYCYTAAIEACAKVKQWKKALSLLEQMERENILPSEVTYSVTITACGNGGNWEKALELLTVMRKKEMKINIITYNAAIAALSKAAKSEKGHHSGNALWKTALDLLDRMKHDDIEPDGCSYSSAISCCGAYGKWEEALRLFEQMKAGGSRTQPNKIAYTAAISSCAKAGQVENAVRLFREMKDRGLAPDLVTYNSMFSAFRVAGEGHLAYALWNEMIHQEPAPGPRSNAVPAPDFITVQETIGAMTRAESNEGVDKVFADAVERGIIFDAESFDTSWEVDLTKMTLSVARAACRFLLGRAFDMYQADVAVEDLVFITGLGRNHDADHPSLREFVREVLARDFTPPLPSEVPQRASGTVMIKKENILAWAREQQQ